MPNAFPPPKRLPPLVRRSPSPKPIPPYVQERFTLFWKGPLSNWHLRDFTVDGVVYNCVEQFMMAEKARLFGDTVREAAIMKATAPGVHKALGKAVTPFVEEVWKANDVAIVKRGLRPKFEQNPDLLRILLAGRGTIFVEASPYDDIWGIKRGPDDPLARDRRHWRGQNKLGFALTDVCEELALIHDPDALPALSGP